MKKNQVFASLGAGALFLLFLIYLGFQVFSNLTDRITTSDALLVSVEDKISCEGVFIRAEQPLYGKSGGHTRLLADNGEKLAAGQTYAIRFPDAGSDSAYARAAAVEQEIAATKYAYQQGTVSTSVQVQDVNIFNGLSQLAVQLQSGVVDEADELYTDVSYLVIGRQYYYGNKEAYTARLTELELELEQYRGNMTSAGTPYKAPASGYYLRYPDGWDDVFDPARLRQLGGEGFELTPDLIRSAETGIRAPAENSVGSLVTDFEWYYAAVMPALEAARLEGRKTCDLYFPQLSATSLRMQLHSIQYYGQEAVVLFRSDRMDVLYLENRCQSADVVAATHEGLRVPKEALRQSEGKWGVYTLSGAVARFKPIDWICETETAYIVEPAPSQSKGLYYYDKIIVTGKDISEGKVVGN